MHTYINCFGFLLGCIHCMVVWLTGIQYLQHVLTGQCSLTVTAQPGINSMMQYVSVE